MPYEIRIEITGVGRWRVSHKEFNLPPPDPSFDEACAFVKTLSQKPKNDMDRLQEVTENYRKRALKAELKLNDIRSVLNRD